MKRSRDHHEALIEDLRDDESFVEAYLEAALEDSVEMYEVALGHVREAKSAKGNG